MADAADVRTLLDCAFDSSLTISEDGTIEEINAAAEVLFGRPREEMIGLALSALIDPIRSPKELEDGLPQSTGGISPVDRNSPPIALAAHARWLFWDGRADLLWVQALGPPENERGIGRHVIGRRSGSRHAPVAMGHVQRVAVHDNLGDRSAVKLSQQVRKRDLDGLSILDSSPKIGPTSLALSGSTLYWTKAGIPQAARLR